MLSNKVSNELVQEHRKRIRLSPLLSNVLLISVTTRKESLEREGRKLQIALGLFSTCIFLLEIKMFLINLFKFIADGNFKRFERMVTASASDMRLIIGSRV